MCTVTETPTEVLVTMPVDQPHEHTKPSVDDEDVIGDLRTHRVQHEKEAAEKMEELFNLRKRIFASAKEERPLFRPSAELRDLKRQAQRAWQKVVSALVEFRRSGTRPGLKSYQTHLEYVAKRIGIWNLLKSRYADKEAADKVDFNPEEKPRRPFNLKNAESLRTPMPKITMAGRQPTKQPVAQRVLHRAIATEKRDLELFFIGVLVSDDPYLALGRALSKGAIEPEEYNQLLVRLEGKLAYRANPVKTPRKRPRLFRARRRLNPLIMARKAEKSAAQEASGSFPTGKRGGKNKNKGGGKK